MRRSLRLGRVVVALVAILAAVPWGLHGVGAVGAEAPDPNGVAVIIGNAEYRGKGVPDARYAHRDAAAFRHFVTEVLDYNPDNVMVLRDADRATLESMFGTERRSEGVLWHSLKPGGGSDVVVYYSGHGVPGPDGRDYLLPVDVDPNAAEFEGYPLSLLYENLSKLEEARSVRVFVDAGFSGGSHDGVLTPHTWWPLAVRKALPEAMKQKLTVLIAVSGVEVASWDEDAQHGFFTHHLLDALDGKADANRDGQVTAAEVKRYLDHHMTRAVRRQHLRVQRVTLEGREEVVLSAARNGGFAARPVLESGD